MKFSISDFQFPIANTRQRSAKAAPRAIEVHIEELVLHDFQPHERHRIADALQRELTRLFSNSNLPSLLARGGTRERVDGGAFHLPAGAKPEISGAHVARAVYGGLRKSA